MAGEAVYLTVPPSICLQSLTWQADTALKMTCADRVGDGVVIGAIQSPAGNIPIYQSVAALPVLDPASIAGAGAEPR